VRFGLPGTTNERYFGVKIRAGPISTRDLGDLPPVPTLEQYLQSLAMLDAILSPEWNIATSHSIASGISPSMSAWIDEEWLW